MLGRELTSLSHLLLTKDFRYLRPAEWSHLRKAAEYVSAVDPMLDACTDYVAECHWVPSGLSTWKKALMASQGFVHEARLLGDWGLLVALLHVRC